jgi:hypothetical protein
VRFREVTAHSANRSGRKRSAFSPRGDLIYTGITRGKRLVVLVGQKKALAMAVKGKQVERRWSKLKERLVTTGQ